MASTSAVVGVTAAVWPAPFPGKASSAAITAAGYFMVLLFYPAAALLIFREFAFPGDQAESRQLRHLHEAVIELQFVFKQRLQIRAIAGKLLPPGCVRTRSREVDHC